MYKIISIEYLPGRKIEKLIGESSNFYKAFDLAIQSQKIGDYRKTICVEWNGKKSFCDTHDKTDSFFLGLQKETLEILINHLPHIYRNKKLRTEKERVFKDLKLKSKENVFIDEAI